MWKSSETILFDSHIGLNFELIVCNMLGFGMCTMLFFEEFKYDIIDFGFYQARTKRGLLTN